MFGSLLFTSDSKYVTCCRGDLVCVVGAPGLLCTAAAGRSCSDVYDVRNTKRHDDKDGTKGK